MRSIALAAALAAFTMSGASAQTTTQPAHGNSDTAATMTPNSGAPGAAGSSPGAAPSGPNNGQAAASGNDNQAIATTSANAATPASGANSFTRGQAANRIASHGYSDVTGLKTDSNGVWRGQAMKGGQRVNVWLDYKGNVGQQ